MKKYFLTGSAMLVLGGFLASCTHDDLDYSSIVENKKAAYQEVFVKTYGKIDPNQTWGFGTEAASAARGLTRAVFTETWGGKHGEGDSKCLIDESKFNFTVPSNAVDLTKGSFTDAEKNATEFVIPKTFNGEVNFSAFNIPAGAKIYNLGTITGFSANHNGVTTFYNVGTMTYSISSGSRHAVINTGTLKVTTYANIGDVYNGGTLVLAADADVPNDMHIYSNDIGSVMMPNGGDMKAVCDIHGTLYVGDRDNNVVKNVKIQNSTRKYICGIDCTGLAENVDGPLETSYVKANIFKFDGNPIYLLPGGHVDVTTLQVPNENCHFYGAAGSTGLVEAVNYEFGNKNDFTHTFSNNIYFKVNGGYIKCDNCYAMGHSHYFNNVDEYLAFDGHTADNKTDEYALAKDRINAGDASGSPACGQAWSIGNTDVTIPTDQGETTGGQIEVVTITKKFETIKLHDAGRVFCEDLGQISTNDLDFNDVVFDAYIYKITPSTQTIVKENGIEVSNTTTVDGEPTYKAAIVLLAAGGTLQLSVAGVEVHNALGGNSISTIINTITSADEAYNNTWVTNAPVILGEDFDYPSIADIPIVVLYGNGEKLELKAEQGWAPHKIRVPIGTKWCKERVDIATAYLDFNNYVNSSKDFWEEGSNINEERLYPSEVTYTLSTKEETKQVSEEEKTTYRSDEGSTTGGYQGEPVLSRELR